MGARSIGLAIGEKSMTAVEGYKKEGLLVISDVYSLERGNDLAKDCSRFVKRHALENCRMAVALAGESRSACRLIPAMTSAEIQEMLEWQVEDYISWPKDSYFYDYAVKNGTDEAQKLLFVVALKRDPVITLSGALGRTEADVEIIDFWPAPMANLFPQNQVIYTLTEVSGKKGQLNLEAWYKGIAVYSAQTESDPRAAAEAMTKGEKELERLGLPPAAGGILFLPQQEQKIEQVQEEAQKPGKKQDLTPDQNSDQAERLEEWQAIAAEFPFPLLERLHILPKAMPVINLKGENDLVAAGLLWRICRMDQEKTSD